jgi:hypothetical protein
MENLEIIPSDFLSETEKKENDITNKFKGTRGHQPADLTEIYKRICRRVIDNGSLTGVENRDLSKVPLLLFNIYNNIINLSNNAVFYNLFCKWYLKRSNRTKKYILKNLWYTFLYYYPIEDVSFSKWLVFFQNNINTFENKELKSLLNIAKNYRLFSLNRYGLRLCARDIFKHMNINQALSKREITDALAVGECAQQIYLQCFEDIFLDASTFKLIDSIEDRIRLLKDHNLLNIIKNDILKTSNLISSILTPLASNFPLFIKYINSIIKFIKSEFKDVRLSPNNHWSNVDYTLKELFKKLIAMTDIERFFDFYSHRGYCQECKQFWTKYLLKGMINETWPILSPITIARINHEKLEGMLYGKLQIGMVDESAILLKIGSLVLVEITADYACYIYPENHSFCPPFGNTGIYDITTLRYSYAITADDNNVFSTDWLQNYNDGKIIKIIHSGQWQKNIRKIIFDITGLAISDY